MAVTAMQMVEKLTTALATNPAGVVSISIDGQQVTYSRQQALDELTFWERRAIRSTGQRPTLSSMRLDGGFGGGTCNR